MRMDGLPSHILNQPERQHRCSCHAFLLLCELGTLREQVREVVQVVNEDGDRLLV